VENRTRQNNYRDREAEEMKKKSQDEEIVILDDMLDVLVELLEEKGIITTEELEAKIKKKIARSTHK
jgi:hypothetical protein